jgi:putative ABC transport system permease protein
MGFVSMTEAIVVAIKIVSFLVIFIIMAVMANTMAMTVRERMAEYATLKALGFGPGHLTLLIFGESLVIACFGSVIGILLTFPVADRFGKAMGTLFPVFHVNPETLYMQISAGIIVGSVAALLPCVRAMHMRIVDGLRNIG